MVAVVTNCLTEARMIENPCFQCRAAFRKADYGADPERGGWQQRNKDPNKAQRKKRQTGTAPQQACRVPGCLFDHGRLVLAAVARPLRASDP